MKKTILCAFSLTVALALSARSAELRSTLGTVEIQRAGSTTWQQGRPKSEVKSGDTVRTGVGSQTEIHMNEGHRISLKERTALKMNTAGGETSFSLAVGRVRAFVSKLRAKNKFEIKTPVAVASIRGTLFELEAAEDGASRLSVLEGVVSYRDLAGLGSEVQVLKGQSVMIEPGAAPKPPEPLPQEMQQGLAPVESAKTAAALSLKSEVQREAGLSAFKEFFQADAAEEMKRAQYMEGKTMIDAFGKIVRLEEYIARPADNQWSFVALNWREDRTDFTRFDLYAKNAIPDDISSVNLYSSNGTMTNWVEKEHRLTSNGGDYYREWKEGGTPTNVSGGGQKVYFNNWFVEAKGAGAAPTLLSHWVPDVGNLSPTGGAPNNYKNYSADADATVGNARGIDAAGYSNAQRLDFYTNAAVAASYRGSEGYSRTTQSLYDDKVTNIVNEKVNASKFTQVTTYSVPGGSAITYQNDTYLVSDDGKKYSLLEALPYIQASDGYNKEDVGTSSLFGNRKIDVVISPSIFQKAGLGD